MKFKGVLLILASVMKLNLIRFLLPVYFLCAFLGFGQGLDKSEYTKTSGAKYDLSLLAKLNPDTAKVGSMLSQLYREKHNLHSILLVNDDQIILESYFNGFSDSTKHDLRSVTKSIRSILVGIAIDKGFIKSIDDPISDYLKPLEPKKNPDKQKDKITIRHLLTMSSGLDCNDWDQKSMGQEDKVYKKKDWLQYTLDLPMVHEPGATSAYCSMGVVLLAEIISRASGLPVDKFAETYLFEPLKIDNVAWGHTSSKEVIPSGKRLFMTPRDLAKVGQLILNQGIWEGKQIVSSTWITESTSPKTKITGLDYGYLWWNIPLSAGKKKVIAITATGNGGQYVMVVPEMNMVAVFTGGAYNSQDDKLPFAIMQRVLLPLLSTSL